MEIKVKYDGKAVKNGTMAVQDVINAIEGLNGAYAKIVAKKNSSKESDAPRHELRVVAFKKGSFGILIEAVEFYKQNKIVIDPLVKNLNIVSESAFYVVGSIFTTIKVLKHLKGQKPKSVTPIMNNTLKITNFGNMTIDVPQQVYELSQDPSIRGEISKLSEPLEKGKIDTVEITAKESKGKKKKATIKHTEKKFFKAPDVVITKRHLEVKGKMISLNKERLDGTFDLESGGHTNYHLGGEDPKNLISHFVYNGPVKIKAEATMDENEKIQHLEIYAIEELQERLL